MPYTEAQQFFDEDYPGGKLRHYWKSVNLSGFGDAAIDTIVAYALRQPSPVSTTDIWHIGGAVRRTSEEGSAFVGRHTPFLFNVEANWEDPQEDQANTSWARGFVTALRGFSDGTRYFNFPGLHEEGEEIMRATFSEKYERLVALKNKCDPTNLFSLNQNVKPTV